MEMDMNKCPNCNKENTLQPYEALRKMRGFEVLGRGEQCTSCKEVVFPLADVQRQEQEVAAKLVERGIRDGKEFQFVRKVAEIKATDLADLLGVRAETVSRWERGEQPVPLTAAFTLGELYTRPRVVRKQLEAIGAHG
jgi:DNA-binding transcriptional regulator YiaG